VDFQERGSDYGAMPGSLARLRGFEAK